MLEIRPATPADVPVMTEIARAAKASWGYPDEWLAQWRDQLRFTDEYLDRATVLVAVRAEGLVGVGAVALDPGPDLEHLWVRPDAQGEGIGSALLHRLVAEYRAQGFGELRIVSDPYAAPFYRRHGAVEVGVDRSEVCGVARELPVFRLDISG